MKIKSSDGRVLKVSPQDERAVRAMIESGNHEGVDAYFKKAESESFKKGGMLKRKDGSYSRRGLWDNIRANRGSGKKPTKEMLKQEAKIRAKAGTGLVVGSQAPQENFGPVKKKTFTPTQETIFQEYFRRYPERPETDSLIQNTRFPEEVGVTMCGPGGGCRRYIAPNASEEARIELYKKGWLEKLKQGYMEDGSVRKPYYDRINQLAENPDYSNDWYKKYIPWFDEVDSSGKKIRPKQAAGGTVFKGYVTEQPMGDAVPWHTSTIGETMGKGGYTVKRSSARKGKTHVVIGPDGTKKYFGDSKLGQHPGNPKRKKAFYARHAKNLKGNPYFRAFARATWADGGKLTDNMYDLGIMPYDFGGPLHHNPSVYGISPSHSTAMRIGYETDLNPDGTIHTPYGFETAAYNERMGLGGLFGKAKEGVGNFFDRNGKDFLKNVGTNAIDDLRDTGAIAYGIGEGFLDTATFGATDSLTDAGYKGLQKIGGTKAEDIKHQDKLHGIGTIGGAGLGAAFTGNIAGAAQQGLKGGNQWLQNSNASAGLKQNLGAGLQVGQMATGFLGGGAGSLGNINNASAMANFANTGMGQFSNNAAQIGNMFNMGQQFGLPLNSMISRHGGYVHMADGGQTGLVPINVEGANFSEGYGPDAKKGELLVLNGKVIKNYVGRPPHPAEGQNPMGNDDAPEGLIVIPKARTKEYLEAGLEKRKQIERSLVSQQQDREMKKSNMMADGGKTKKSGNANRWNAYNDPYTVIAMPDRNSSFAEDSVRVFPGQRLFGKTPYMRDLGNQMGVITTEWNPYYELPKGARMYQDSTYMYANPEFLPRRKKGDGGYYSFGMGDQGMGYGGPIGNPETIDSMMGYGYKKGGWIQKATASIKRRGTEGVCTGSKFGSSSCPPGSRRYNLAKTFKKMARARHEQGGFIDPVTGSHTVMYGQGGQLPEGLLRARMRASGASPEEINSYVATRYEMGGATNVTHDFPIRRLKYGNQGMVGVPYDYEGSDWRGASPMAQPSTNIQFVPYDSGAENDWVGASPNKGESLNKTTTPGQFRSNRNFYDFGDENTGPGPSRMAMPGTIRPDRSFYDYEDSQGVLSGIPTTIPLRTYQIPTTSSTQSLRTLSPFVPTTTNTAANTSAGSSSSFGVLRPSEENVSVPSYLTPGGGYGDIYNRAAADAASRYAPPAWWMEKTKGGTENTPYRMDAPDSNVNSGEFNYGNLINDFMRLAPVGANLAGAISKRQYLKPQDFMQKEMNFVPTTFDYTPYEQAGSRAQYQLRQMGSGPGYKAGIANIAAQVSQGASGARQAWANQEAVRRSQLNAMNADIQTRNIERRLQIDDINRRVRAAGQAAGITAASQLGQIGSENAYLDVISGKSPRKMFTGYRG